MAGNVWEWTASWHETGDGATNRTLKGGGWNYDGVGGEDPTLSARFRVHSPPRVQDGGVYGFRCASEPLP